MGLRDLLGLPHRVPDPQVDLALRSSSAWRGPTRRHPPSMKSWDPTDVGRLYNDFVGDYLPADESVRTRQRIEQARARQLHRENPWARKAADLYRANVFGPHGMQLIPTVTEPRRGPDGRVKQVPDRAANDLIAAAWKRWGRKGICTVDGEQSFVRAQKLAGAAYERDGEVFIRHFVGPTYGPFGYQIRVIESDFVPVTLNQAASRNGNEIRMGIERDASGRALAYYIGRVAQPLSMLAAAVDTYARPTDYQRVPADEVTHFYNADRVHQTRGLPAQEAGINSLHMLGGYELNELVASRVAAGKMGFFTSADGEGYEGDDYSDPDIIDTVEPGVLEQLPDGVQFSAFDPQHPTTAFNAFIKQMLRRFTAATKANYHSVSGDLESVNYSSLRQGALSERDLWISEQADFARDVLDEIYARWLPQALLGGEIQLPILKLSKFMAHRWQARRWPWIDPQKEANANKTGLETLQTTVTQIAADNGWTPRELMENIVAERDLASELGLGDILPYGQNSDSPPDGGGDGPQANDEG